MDFWRQLFSSGNFMPHGYCYLWNRSLVRLHVSSDLLIALAYFSIPLTLIYFVRRRRDLPFHWMFMCFGVFIVACGMTHLMDVWTLWHATYWLSGAIKAVTALASVSTAILLVRLVPTALALPAPADLREINLSLANRRDALAGANANLEAANDALRHSEERFKSFIQSAPDAMVIVNQDGEIVLVNSQTEALFEYSAEELLNKKIEILMPERYREPHTANRNDFNADPKIRPMGAGLELHARRKDGSEFPVEISLSPMRTETGTLVSAAIRDITDRKFSEAALNQQRSDLLRSNTELTAMNKELEAFSYSVSHDLRAPLRSIDGFSLALLEDFGDKLDAEGKENLQRVRAATQRMGVLIDDLLNLSRMTRTGMKLEEVDLSAMARGIAAGLQNTQPERHADFRIHDQLREHADSHLMKIALENLLGNAWKFTSKRDSARIEFGKTRANGKSVYFVRDDGAGFDTAYADRLFGAFQRLHDSSEFPGNGIGLATVQRIIHRHGGQIWAESTVGKGATFYFTVTHANQFGD